MSKGPDASSSDVERARELSKRLEVRAPQPTASPKPSGSYIRFDARFAPPSADPARSPPQGVPPRPAGSDWNALLEWVRIFAAANVVVLGDARGLLVAFCGDIAHERAEAMGARLALAFEQADRMAERTQPSRFLVFDFRGLVVSGLRIALPEGEPLVLGVAGPRTLEPGARDAVEKALEERARG